MPENYIECDDRKKVSIIFENGLKKKQKISNQISKKANEIVSKRLILHFMIR